MKTYSATNIAISKLKDHPLNPRKNIGDITEMVESVKKNGIMQNLTVIPENGDSPECDKYIILIGHRRFHAAKAAGIDRVPCRIITGMTEREQVSVMLEENMQRTDLTIYEQAQGFQMMLDLGETAETIADKTGFAKSTIYHRLNLAKLDKDIFKSKQEDESFQLTLQDMYALEKISDIEIRNKILEESKSSRDIEWKVNSEVQKIRKQKQKEAYLQMFEEHGVEKAPEDVKTWSSGWKQIARFDIDGSDSIKDWNEEYAGTVYIDNYGLYLMKKEEQTQIKEKSDEEIQREILQKKRKGLESKIDNLKDLLEEAVVSICIGKVADIDKKQEPALIEALWKIIELDTKYDIDRGIEILNDGTPKSDDEEEMIKKEYLDLKLHKRMLIAAYDSASSPYISTYQLKYNKILMEPLMTFYNLLRNYYGYSMSRDYIKIMDGSSELYEGDNNAKQTE